MKTIRKGKYMVNVNENLLLKSMIMSYAIENM